MPRQLFADRRQAENTRMLRIMRPVVMVEVGRMMDQLDSTNDHYDRLWRELREWVEKGSKFQ